MNEYYLVSDGFFTYYVNKTSGEKKFQLNDGDIVVQTEYDDFDRLS